jgi:membrane-bound lytic murein transglycosylase D
LLLLAAGVAPAAFAAETDNGDASGRSGVSELLDSLVTTTYFQDGQFQLSTPGRTGSDAFPRQFVPQFNDDVYSSRIEELARKSRFKLVYNEHVKGFIRVYAVDKRKQVSKMLGLSRIYFPMIEEKLRQYDIPQEMKYLVIVESGLNPTAVSHAGARGLWQFMGGTGRMYGLSSSSFIEDRYDTYKATVAACEHLRDLYDMFGDWFLVLAAYNSGAGNVRKAIRRAGGATDYWEIWPYLPLETRGYVPAFIAVTYVMNYHDEHNIRPVEPGPLYLDTERVPVKSPLTFEQLRDKIGVPVDDLRFLNPQYKVGLIPAPSSNPNMLRLPRKYVQPFMQQEQELYAYQTEQAREREQLYAMVRDRERQESAGVTQTRARKMHVVRRGETLAGVARKYRVPVSQLIRWNNLKGSRVKAGQSLVVFKSDGERSVKSSKASVKAKKGKKGKAGVSRSKLKARSKAAIKKKKAAAGKKNSSRKSAKARKQR